MFGNNKIIDKLRDKLTQYIDTKFEDYRGQIAEDLSEGLAALAGLVAIWTMGIVCLVFAGFAAAFLLAWLLCFIVPSFLLSCVISFTILAIAVLSLSRYLILNKAKYIEEPTHKVMSKVLRSPSWEKRRAEEEKINEDLDKEKYKGNLPVKLESIDSINDDESIPYKEF